MGGIQHQLPDTTSPSPPHGYNMNGSAVANTSSFPSAMLPQGKELHIQMSEFFIPLFCSGTPVPVWGQPAATPVNSCN